VSADGITARTERLEFCPADKITGVIFRGTEIFSGINLSVCRALRLCPRTYDSIQTKYLRPNGIFVRGQNKSLGLLDFVPGLKLLSELDSVRGLNL
jgi:hypothetical protein